MKKRVCAFLCALLMLTSFSCCALASIMVEDETGTYFDSDGYVPKQTSAFSEAVKKALGTVSNFWHRFGFVTVVILLLAAIVIAIVISEFERQKKESRPPKPLSKKKRKH